jgi:SAM-dependent methyltransferase
MDRDALRVARSSRWVDVHSAVGAPRRGDGFAIVGRFSKPDGMTAAECCVRVASPYSGSATGWLALRVAVAGRTVLDVDLVEFGGSFILTAPTTDDSVDVRVDVVALKDCNDWGWGGAMRTCVEVLGWQSVKATNLPGPRLTYPGNTVDADPEPQPPHLEETLAARVHWASQGREDFYDTGQHWRTYMAERVRAYRPRSVLEFGCNAGRNLVEVRRLLPAAKVIGIDINAEAVAHGHEKYGLDLRVGGEELLTKHDERAIDVLFTVSVLDHLPHAEEVLREITRIAGTAVILLEPFTGQSRRVDVATDAPALTTVLYTYAWDYPEMCNRVAPDWHWTWTPYPLSGENLGPNYWLIEGTRSVRRE